MKTIDLTEYLGLVASIRIDHRCYEHAMEELGSAFRSVGKAANPLCLHIVGDTRTGKSTVIEDFILQHRLRQEPSGNRQTVVYAKIPDKGSVKGLLERLLQALGDPHWHRGSETNQTHRLLTLLRAVRCRMIILDEFQHLCDKGQDKILRRTADWLKMLVDSKEWALVAVGLLESASVIQSNRQLKERFDAAIKMPMFDWREDASRREFKAVLNGFQEQLEPFELPDLMSNGMALRMFLATAGRIGIAAKLLDRAVRNAIKRGSVKIRTEDLQIAFDQAVWYADKFPLSEGPFGASLEDCGENLVLQKVIEAANEDLYADKSGDVSVTGQDTAGSSPGRNKTDKSRVGRSESRRKERQIKDALRGAA